MREKDFELIRSCSTKQQLEYVLYDYLMEEDLIGSSLSSIIKILKELKLNDIARTLYIVPITQIFRKSNDIDRISISFNIKDKDFIKDIYDKVFESYTNVLNQTKQLSNELDVKNSLEMCILYSYLLYGGYYSQNGTHSYKIEDRVMIPGMFFHEIFKGRGVCLNYSDMLCDLLNVKGYNAAILGNKVNDCKDVGYRIPIERGFIKPTLLSRIKIATSLSSY